MISIIKIYNDLKFKFIFRQIIFIENDFLKIFDVKLIQIRERYWKKYWKSFYWIIGIEVKSVPR